MSAGAERAGGTRRELTYAVLCCLAGAGLALYAADRIWVVELTPRPPLPPVRGTRSGGDLLPWLSALALVGLAGTGAVLATRGAVRRLVGALLLAVALGVAGGGAYGVLALDRGDGSPAWPVLCVVGGLLAAGGATLTAARSQRWPVMGARYERPGAAEPAADAAGAPEEEPPVVPASSGAGSGRTAEGAGRFDGRRTRAAWDALDRGEDPTATGPDGREQERE